MKFSKKTKKMKLTYKYSQKQGHKYFSISKYIVF